MPQTVVGPAVPFSAVIAKIVSADETGQPAIGLFLDPDGNVSKYCKRPYCGVKCVSCRRLHGVYDNRLEWGANVPSQGGYFTTLICTASKCAAGVPGRVYQSAIFNLAQSDRLSMTFCSTGSRKNTVSVIWTKQTLGPRDSAQLECKIAKASSCPSGSRTTAPFSPQL
jgi:hypothetical protein